MIIRVETTSDRRAVYDVVSAAFKQTSEAELVEALNEAGDIVISLVVEHEQNIIGHVALSKMEAPFPALALAPVSVKPDRQRMGIGSRLIHEAIDRAKGEGWAAIFVLGSPKYYERFGFDVAAAKGFSSPYAGGHFMILRLSGTLTDSGQLTHAPAFAALD